MAVLVHGGVLVAQGGAAASGQESCGIGSINVTPEVEVSGGALVARGGMVGEGSFLANGRKALCASPMLSDGAKIVARVAYGEAISSNASSITDATGVVIELAPSALPVIHGMMKARLGMA